MEKTAVASIPQSAPTFSVGAPVPTRKTHCIEALDAQTGAFTHAVGHLERRLARGAVSEAGALQDFAEAVAALCRVCAQVEEAFVGETHLLKALQDRVRERTASCLRESRLVQHARTWPQGYPGDYRMVEHLYRDMPLSAGIGGVADRYLLSSTLGAALRARRAAVRELVREELCRRTGAQVLNVGCGSCREVFELAPEIERSGATVTCLDFDAEALEFAAGRMALTGAASQVKPVRYNAVRLVNPGRNIREFGRQDVIYTMGLLDYFTDDLLLRLLPALYETLAPGGLLIAAFKDSDRYDHREYHWLVDWDAFYQRPAAASRRLLEEAGIPARAVSASRDRTGVIVIYSAVREGAPV